MFSFLSLVFDGSDSEQSMTARQLSERVRHSGHDWHLALNAPGLRVYCQGWRLPSCQCYSLSGGSGVVLGTLFERGSQSYIRQSQFQPRQSEAIVASGGRELIATHWGSYVAFLANAHEQKTSVLRAPAGHLPCFRACCNGIYVYFSQDFLDVEPNPPPVDWSYIAAALVMPRESEHTGWQGVQKIQAGECVQHTRGQVSRQQYWNPAEVACRDPIEDPKEAAASLRQVTKECVNALASCHTGILENLSGGIDSSILLGCLRDAPTRPAITCLNLYSPGCLGDERDYARLAAQRANCKLVERPRNSLVDLHDMMKMSRYPEPLIYFKRIELSEMQTRLAREHGATAIFSGSGGDEIFYQGYPALAAADCLQLHRFHRFPRAAYDAAQLEGWSMWKVMNTARSEVFRRDRQQLLTRISPYSTLLIPERIRELWDGNRSVPLWMQVASRVPPSKRWQIVSLKPQQYYDPLGSADAPESVAPFISQPIIEVALRIPAYLSIAGGWSRAVAREAFASDIPEAIKKRRTKGRIEEHVLAMLMHNITFARELLLDGALVREGLLDRGRVEAALSDRPSAVLKDLAEVFDYVCYEAWIQKMTSAPQREAA